VKSETEGNASLPQGGWTPLDLMFCFSGCWWWLCV